MKKIMLFAAACVALAACSKTIETPTSGDATYFEKGQKVTLTVGIPGQTKATSTADATTGEISFKWENDDAIKVTVGTESATFTVSKLIDGGTSAEFTGTMPGDGKSFSAQFPVTDPDANLTTQTYSATEALPHDKMKFTATDCTLGNSFTLAPQYAALRLNLYGGAREVSQIDVTCSSSSTYTLSISPAVTVGKDKENATPFFIVLPATESFASAAVTASAIAATTENTPTYTEGTFSGVGIPISASTTFIATEAKSLSPGSILNMPAVSLTTVWAPVNCGYVPKTGDSGAALGYPYGKLYQWGRKDGQGYYKAGSGPTPIYEDATYPSGDNLAVGPISDIMSVSAEKFYGVTTSPYNWYSGSSPAANDLWKEDGSSIYDPCPEGWRVPTMSELDRLAGGDGSGNANLGYSGWDSTNKGYWFNGTKSPEVGAGLFLPAAGSRNCFNGSASYRGYSGYYWSSSVSSDGASNLLFGGGSASMSGSLRASGCSVRCVQE